MGSDHDGVEHGVRGLRIDTIIQDGLKEQFDCLYAAFRRAQRLANDVPLELPAVRMVVVTAG